jgi:hypothetical protein
MATATKVLIELSRTSDKVSRMVDATAIFQAGAAQTTFLDVSGWDIVTVQIVTPSAAINFTTTNDNGYVTGVLPPVPIVPANFLAVQGINVGTGTAVTSLAASGIVKFTNFAKFLQIA